MKLTKSEALNPLTALKSLRRNYKMNNHTPGPWRIGDAGQTIFGPPNGNPSPKTIASISTWVFQVGEENRANAHLIAAAPELLDACQTALNKLKPTHCSEHLTVMRKLIAAIAKATT